MDHLVYRGMSPQLVMNQRSVDAINVLLFCYNNCLNISATRHRCLLEPAGRTANATKMQDYSSARPPRPSPCRYACFRRNMYPMSLYNRATTVTNYYVHTAVISCLPYLTMVCGYNIHSVHVPHTCKQW